jgi:type I restriction enzyme, S subunit
MSDELFELPKGWQWVKLVEIAAIKGGLAKGKRRKPTDSLRQIPYLRVANVQRGFFNLEEVLLIEATEAEIEELRLRRGDILFNEGGDRDKLGRGWVWMDEIPKCIHQNHVFRARPYFSELQSKYISWYGNTFGQAYFLGEGKQTTNLASINLTKLSNLPLPLPPVNEQKRIVARIEELRDRHQRAKQALEAVPQLCDRFRQSVLAAAFRGDLTADWREQNPDVEPASALLERTARELRQNFEQVTREIERSSQDLPDSWAWAKFNLFIKGIQAGKNFSCPEVPVTEDTIGLVKISAVTWGKFNPKETKTVDDLSKVDSNLFIQKGDFLISRANTLELVGASVVVDEINYEIMLSDKVWRVDFLEIDKRFINFYLKSLYGRKEIESRATGNQLSMRNISQSAFKDIVVALPPLKEQQEIATQVENIFRGIDRIVEQYQNTRGHLDRLNQSILAKAFRGELVEQDSNDEPASVLLDCIRAEREVQQLNKASRGKGTGRQRKKAVADE